MGRRTDLSSLLSSDKGGQATAAAAPKKRPDTRPLTVAVTDLAENPDNPRHELRDLEGLAETVRERGVLQALGVVPAAVFLAAHPRHKEAVGEAAYVVLHGHRRLAAARMAGLDEVPVLVRDDATRSDEDALIENVQRDDLTELEQAQAIQGLITAYGYSQRQVAARIGKTQGFISQRLSLMKLREDIQEALADGRVSVEDARRIARLPRDEQELPGPFTAAVPAARQGKPERRKNDYGVIELDSRSTPEEIVEALRRHLAPAALDRVVRLLSR
ncbi:ParB/RepB/Spo0J family partition protein [Streptomyces sp. VRA16 Mangrove soil]|uniref:ParB/RepB/Spo0J family partition protein n=1 Tax=Streptomyces sp. VRA16 Mangrove soil TaxID=2817434 RepID=UPI001A9F036F|nr:ParB/RepB/Spo0J family partition protein [Streptomyces sp. VRA16 Mangrove soil]MBO1333586.1 ParB/RepB/Spo0J family partition protein [Streptomyces sp. VRA16 Mangrove soil]